MMERDFNSRIERDARKTQGMIEETIVEEIPEGLWPSIIDTYRKIKELKPEERSERARRFAVLLTEYEKMMSYYLIMLDNDDFVG